MPDNTAAKARRTSTVDRMANLAAVPTETPAGAEPAAESAARPAPAPRQAKRERPTRRAMAVEQPQPKPYPARISHATTYEQLEELENVGREARRERPELGAVPVTALLRAAAEICLDNDQFRKRMVRDARERWAAK